MGLYYQKRQTIKNYQKAIEHFNESVRLGYLPAYVKLGETYQFEIGVNYDINIAISYYLRGALLGDRQCITLLALLFQSGEGFILDNIIAYNLHKLANTEQSIKNMELLASYFPEVLYQETNIDYEYFRRLFYE